MADVKVSGAKKVALGGTKEGADLDKRGKTGVQQKNVGFAKIGDVNAVLPRLETEELERRGKIVRDSPLSQEFITPTEARARGRTEQQETLNAADKLRLEAEAARVGGEVETPTEDKGILERIGDTEIGGLGDVRTIFGGQQDVINRGGGVPLGPVGAVGAAAEAASLANKAGIFNKARATLRALMNKKVVLFDKSLGFKEFVTIGLAGGSGLVEDRISVINREASLLGTEKNEKIARSMVSGLDPESAIAVYNEDLQALYAGQESLQLLKIYSFRNYLTGSAGAVDINLNNQIEGKLSRIDEANKFRAGLSTGDIQAAIASVDQGELNE